MKRLYWVASAVCVAASLVVVSCSNDGGPTNSSVVTQNSPSVALTTMDFSNRQASGGAQESETDEQFNCTNVGDVRVRFGHPGFVRESNVGLFVEIFRIPDTKMTLRVFWDFAGQPEAFEDVPFADDDLTRDGDFLNLEKIVEHSYPAVSVPTPMRVRVELILADQTGNCARVRDVTLKPKEATGKKGSLITAAGEAYGHHGACSGWNQCGDADTCALWACQAEGYSQLVSWEDAKPCTQWNNCHLFYNGPNNGVEYNWGNWCDVMGVGGIRCK